MSRIYKVKTPTGEKVVKANTKGQAIKHCVSGDYDAEVVSSSDLYDLMQSGVTVEDATAGEAEKNEPAGSNSTASAQPTPASQAPAVTPPAPVPPSSPNPVIAEQQKINPNAAAAAGAPAPAPAQGGPVDWEAREKATG